MFGSRVFGFEISLILEDAPTTKYMLIKKTGPLSKTNSHWLYEVSQDSLEKFEFKHGQ